jgi:hypothetical protein
LCALLLSPAAPAAATADVAPYEDSDSNYLKVIYHFIYPVGKVAELFFFRPVHTVGTLTQPDPRAYEAEEDSGACLSFRPTRRCSRRQ